MDGIDLEMILDMHQDIIEQSGGSTGVRHVNGLQSAIAQPDMTFGGVDLCPTLIDKACALGFF